MAKIVVEMDYSYLVEIEVEDCKVCGEPNNPNGICDSCLSDLRGE